MTHRLLPVVCLSLLTACVGNSVKDGESIQQSAIQQAKATKQDPQTVISDSQTLQLEAQREDLYFYSPTYMEQAEEALEDAEDAIKSNKPTHEVIAHALAAQKLFKRGLENKPTVLKQLSATFSGLEMLKDINTDKVLASDFQDLQDDTKDLIILIEQGKTTQAIADQKELLGDITEVEISTLKKTYLTVVEDALEKADDADAEDFAAKSFLSAQKNIETFELFIESSPKQREAIKNKSSAAIHLAQHAEHVAKAAQPLLKLNPESAEEHILFIETLMARVGTALGQSDVSHLNLNSQSIAIAQAAETINKRANTQVQIAAQTASWEIEKAKLIAEIKQLKSQPQVEVGNNTQENVEEMVEAKTLAKNDEAKSTIKENVESKAILINKAESTEEAKATQANALTSDSPANIEQKAASNENTQKVNNTNLEQSAQPEQTTQEPKSTAPENEEIEADTPKN